ncbi:MAG: hypothetical protein F4X98_08690 [Gammaproteobacteria bacterium]|nr:hypothetical protein [Gammaproteobacteria bacterium]
MKQKQLARLAAFLAGVTGGAAFGHDHLPPVNCSAYPWWCQGYCYELNACRAGNTPIGGSDCWTEENNLAFCELRAPFVQPVPPVVAPPFVPPVVVAPAPACPAGQHFSEGQCQADHECGDDEIGGGAVECQACGTGEVPNQDQTVCQEACGQAATDDAAKQALAIGKKPREQGTALYCHENAVHRMPWSYSAATNACSVTYSMKYTESCWAGGSKETGCNLSRTHTHPYFEYPKDKDVSCHGLKIGSKLGAYLRNKGGMNFSDTDKINAASHQVEGHLGVSNRTCKKAYRWSVGGAIEVFDGNCQDPPHPYEP